MLDTMLLPIALGCITLRALGTTNGADTLGVEINTISSMRLSCWPFAFLHTTSAIAVAWTTRITTRYGVRGVGRALSFYYI